MPVAVLKSVFNLDHASLHRLGRARNRRPIRYGRNFVVPTLRRRRLRALLLRRRPRGAHSRARERRDQNDHPRSAKIRPQFHPLQLINRAVRCAILGSCRLTNPPHPCTVLPAFVLIALTHAGSNPHVEPCFFCVSSPRLIRTTKNIRASPSFLVLGSLPPILQERQPVSPPGGAIYLCL